MTDNDSDDTKMVTYVLILDNLNNTHVSSRIIFSC